MSGKQHYNDLKHHKLIKEDIHKVYKFEGKLGSGSFATVKKATRRSDKKQFAIKVVKKSKLSPDELLVVHDEVEIMHKIEHPNCCHMFEMYETPKKLYMVLELLSGGELFDRIVAKGSFSEKEAADLMNHLVSAVKYLHSVGVVHRDLKPENLLYASEGDDAVIKITDFGLAKFRESTDNMTTACGTPGYVAPEVLKHRRYDREVDMWSLGVILYILLCGFPPFYDENNAKLFKQIKRGDYDFPSPYWDDISADAKDLVKKLLTVDPAKRYTADQVLKHPWMQGNASTKAFSSDHVDRLQVTYARRKFRKGIQLIVATNRFMRVYNEIIADEKKKKKGKH